jgi:bifunctional NMN adenylyltransferase/nudix hydrolase
VSKPTYGVIVGRFQVHELHEGHMELFRAVKGRHNRVIVFVGKSLGGLTKRNPLDFVTRKAMIQAKFPDFTVLPLQDTMTDEVWSASLDAKIREVVDYGDVTLYGSRDSFVPHYSGSYRPVELTLNVSEHVSGADIRERLSNTVIESADFRAGMIYAAANQFPRVITCVDVVMYHYSWRTSTFGGTGSPAPVEFDDCEFLLARKKDEPGWRFIGGHAEPVTKSFEEDAKDEAMQECGQDLSKLEYIGSCYVPDWRYTSEENKIKTLVFASETMTLSAKANDDVSEVKWFSIRQLNEGLLNPVHHPILKLVRERFRKEITLYADVRA